MEAWNDADWTFKQNFLFPFRTAEMLKVSVLQLFCFIKFYRVGQLYCDKHLTPMMFNKCTWYICTRECLNRKRPHPSWKQHYRNTLTCKIQLMRHNEMLLADILMLINTTQCVIYWTVMPMYTFQNDNKESVPHFRAQKPSLKGLWTYLRVQREGHCASGPVVGPDLSVIIHHVFVSISQHGHTADQTTVKVQVIQ